MDQRHAACMQLFLPAEQFVAGRRRVPEDEKFVYK
jgi:hypothetical protein